MKAKIIIAIILVGLGIFAGWVLFRSKTNTGFGVDYVNLITGSDVNHDSILVGTTVTEITAHNSGRVYMDLCNDTYESSIVYLYFGKTSASHNFGQGVRLSAGDCFEIDSNFLYTGVIYGLASPSAASVSFVEVY